MATTPRRSLRLHLWWTAALVLTALGGAGLAVAADRQGNPVERPELTYAADHAAQTWIDALTADLETLNASAADLSTDGRDVLEQLQALDMAAADDALTAGDGASANIETLVAGLRDRSAQADTQIERWRLGPGAAGLLTQLDAATAAAGELPTDWAGLAVNGRAVVSLVDELSGHDAYVFQATGAGRDSRWADAVDLLGQAGAALGWASALRDQLAQVATVETLDDLLARDHAYDDALTALYGYLRDGGAASGATFDALQSAVDAAQAALPGDSDALVVIVGEASGLPIADALLAMEDVHGKINDALQAVSDARNGGPPLDGSSPTDSTAP